MASHAPGIIMGITSNVTIEGTGNYSPSRQHDTPKLPKESDAAYELRTWREKAYYNSDGQVIIPGMAFKFCLMAAASYLAEKVKGKGAKTWTGYFTSAVLIQEDLVLPYKRDDLKSVTINAHVNGKRNSASRVPRTFPLIPKWGGTLPVCVYDETITQEIFQRVWAHAGAFIGMGRFRPQVGGFNGAFVIKKITWKKMSEAA